MLYNGKRRWDAQTEVSRLVEFTAGRLKDYQVNFRYLIIDEGAFSESQVVKERNLAGLLFRLEQSHNPKEMEEAVKLLMEWLADEKGSELYRSFIAWFQRVFIALRYPDGKFTPPQDLQEVRNMLAERVLEWKED